MRELLENGLAALGVTSGADAAAQLARYAALLLEKNEVMNLTAITEPEQVARLHFLDSAALLSPDAPWGSLAGKSVIDVGTGAGFPGLVLRILSPDTRVTLLDALGKRVTWLGEVCADLGFADVTCLHARSEEQSLQKNYRDSYDFAVSRAVAELRVLAELCLPYVKVGGHFLAMKSVGCDEELSEAHRAIRTLGGTVRAAWDYTIPGTDVTHRVVVIEKTAPTPKGYPRRWAKIKASPL